LRHEGAKRSKAEGPHGCPVELFETCSPPFWSGRVESMENVQNVFILKFGGRKLGHADKLSGV